MRVVRGRVYRKHRFQSIPKLGPCAVDAASYGAYRHVEDVGDGFVRTAFHFTKDEYGAMLVAQRCEGCVNLGSSFVAFQYLVGGGANVCRFGTGGVAGVLDGYGGLLFSSTADAEIDRDAVNPGVKGSIVLKRIELDECLDKGFLDDVPCFFAATDHARDGIKKPILILDDQFSECG